MSKSNQKSNQKSLTKNKNEKETFEFTEEIERQIIAMIIYRPQNYDKYASIIKPEHFDNPILQNMMMLISNYYKSYDTTPTQERLGEELEVFLKKNPKLPKEEYKKVFRGILVYAFSDFRYIWDKILDFARYKGVKNAIMGGIRNKLKKRDYKSLLKDIEDASTIGMETQQQIISADELMKLETPPREIYVENWAERNALTIIAGKAKIGKSNLILNLMIDLTLGRKFLDRFEVPKPRKILYIQQELSISLLQDRINKLMKDEDEKRAINKIDTVTTGAEQLKITDIVARNKIYKWIEKRKPDLVVFDPFRNFHNKSENDAIAMAEVLDYFKYIVYQFNVGVILIHHHGKATDIERSKVHLSRGSSVLADVPDSVINLMPLPKKFENVGLDFPYRNYMQLTFDLRSDLSPPDFVIVRNDSNLWHEITEVKGYLKLKATIDDLKEILKNAGNKMSKKDLVEELGVSKPTAYKLINQAEEEKHIRINQLPGKGAPEEIELIKGIQRLFKK